MKQLKIEGDQITSQSIHSTGKDSKQCQTIKQFALTPQENDKLIKFISSSSQKESLGTCHELACGFISLMSVQKKLWRAHKGHSPNCKLVRQIINEIEKIQSDSIHQIDTHRSSIMDIPQQIDENNQNFSNQEENPLDSLEVDSSTLSNGWQPLSKEDNMSHFRSFKNFPQIPYDRFLDICLNANVAFTELLSDRDERMRLAQVIRDANSKLALIDRKLGQAAMDMMSQMIGRKVVSIQCRPIPLRAFNAAQDREYPDNQSQQDVNNQGLQ